MKTIHNSYSAPSLRIVRMSAETVVATSMPDPQRDGIRVEGNANDGESFVRSAHSSVWDNNWSEQ